MLFNGEVYRYTGTALNVSTDLSNSAQNYATNANWTKTFDLSNSAQNYATNPNWKTITKAFGTENPAETLAWVRAAPSSSTSPSRR